ncbi:MAG: DUF924 family protein [Ketobacteraceae bacterium]|nr:DUF924 family protein [Ketobacteraceae bacterium]
MNFEDVIGFWFDTLSEKDWWRKDESLDDRIRDRFAACHERAAAGELVEWRQQPLGRLAEIIVLDQFSRNMFRDTPWMFMWDGMALVLAQEAVNTGADQALEGNQRAFMYMPYMHSESAFIHEKAIPLFEAPGLEKSLKFEKRHKKIIDRFGRFPHRNELLGRTSTDEEIAFLKEPGSSF